MTLKKLATAAAIAVTAAAFVFGSAVSSEAKGKKKAAAPKPAVSCMFTAVAPVCATKGKQKFTYRNACYAGNDGAVVSSQKACPAKAATKGGKKGKKAAKKPAKKK